MNLNKKKPTKLKNMTELVNQTDIASIKNIALGIIKVINDSNSTAKDLEAIIKLDPPLSARILKVANSAYYSQQKISNIEGAIIRIGFNTLKYIALGQKVRNIFSKDEKINGYSRASLWRHSVAVGLLGKLIFDKKFGSGGNNIYAAGLLHDIGIIAEDQLLAEEFRKMLKKINAENKNLNQLEEENLGYNHAELGMAIINQWNFPLDMVMAVGYHHNPINVDPKCSDTVSILHVADIICQENSFGYCDTPFREESVFETCLEKIDLKPDILNSLVTALKEEIAKIESQGFFS